LGGEVPREFLIRRGLSSSLPFLRKAAKNLGFISIRAGLMPGHDIDNWFCTSQISERRRKFSSGKAKAAQAVWFIRQADFAKHGGNLQAVLPGSLLNSGNLSLVCQLAEADTADAVVAQVGVGTAADLAAVVSTGGVLSGALLLDFH
jgi:hypothetical protein